MDISTWVFADYIMKGLPIIAGIYITVIWPWMHRIKVNKTSEDEPEGITLYTSVCVFLSIIITIGLAIVYGTDIISYVWRWCYELLK